MSSHQELITVEALKARADRLGIPLEDAYLEGLATTLDRAKAPLRSLDLQRLRSVEPLLTFTAIPQDNP